MQKMKIGQLASATGVGIDTIRFYERDGVMREPSRTVSGYRQYDEDAVLRIRFIKHAQELGFSLKEIKELLSLRASPKSRCGDIQRKAEAKVADIDAKIQTLRSMKRALSKLIVECSGRGPVTQCPILAAMDS